MWVVLNAYCSPRKHGRPWYSYGDSLRSSWASGCNRSRSLQPKEPRGLEPWLLPETRRAELLGSSGCYWNVFAVGTSKGVTNKKCNFTKNSPFFPPASNLFSGVMIGFRFQVWKTRSTCFTMLQMGLSEDWVRLNPLQAPVIPTKMGP